MRWRFELTPGAARDFKKLDRPVKEAIAQALEHLAGEMQAEATPYTHVRKMAGAPNAWRLRAGDYRTVYELDVRGVDEGRDLEGVIVVVRVGHRRGVYRDR